MGLQREVGAGPGDSHRCAFHLVGDGRIVLGDGDFAACELRESGVQGVDDAPGYMFEERGWRCHFAHNHIAGCAVVERVVEAVAGERRAEVGAEDGIDGEVVAKTSFLGKYSVECPH